MEAREFNKRADDGVLDDLRQPLNGYPRAR